MKPKKDSITDGIKAVPTKNYIAEKCQIFGENMRTARKERGFTSEVLAKFLKISTAYVGLIERGERCPSLETFLRICDFFGESYEAMLTPKSTLSVAESKARSRENDKDQIVRKQKMIMSMINTFDIKELDHIISVVKSFKTFSHSEREGHQDTEFGNDFNFTDV
ncbi:MAG: helix-turn-helix domain-containing protein [Defluviitaleaceae bacterium]|nr:helix-turn-helix domain-containing protein [Defluviitaleaceae bacterium]